jgi:phage anti-repressor protein/predicted GIY-YIG superfamily endonuclease
MEQFIQKFSTLPRKFIKDFFVIAKETYDDNQIIIDFDIVRKWLNVQKGHLKDILVNKFEEDYDYSIEKKQKKQKNSTGKTTYNLILITPNCFKELCMISQTPKAKEVRKYFIEMEKLIKRYHEKIQEEIYKEIGLLKKNQKPKTHIKGGVLYILRALNTSTTLYKIGQTKDLHKRLKTYNSGNANNVEPEFIIPVKDIVAAEACVKVSTKKFQYRKYKEIYSIGLDVLRDLVEKCAEISDKLQIYYDSRKKDTKKKLQRLKKGEERFFIFIDKNDDKKCKI